MTGLCICFLSVAMEGFPPAMPDPGLSEVEARAIAKWITTLK